MICVLLKVAVMHQARTRVHARDEVREAQSFVKSRRREPKSGHGIGSYLAASTCSSWRKAAGNDGFEFLPARDCRS